MPSFELYKKLNGASNVGQAVKAQSDAVMEATWNNDMDSKIAYFYSQEHDDEFETRDDLHPEKSLSKIPVEVKLFEMEYNSLSKDEVAWHLLFKPSFDYRDVIPYYDEDFKKTLHSTFPIGMYFDYPDSKEKYQRWLCVGQYREYGNQFPTFLALPCDHKLQWIYDRKKYESWGVLRSQSSYNSGLWTDFKITTPENQKLIWLPFNEKTSNLFYDQRIVISEPRKEPVVWKCSKVEDMNVKGIIRLTFAQDQWQPHRDCIEKDSDGNVIGLWADYYTDSGVTPSEETPVEDRAYSKITYVGKPNIKAGGSFKKFTVTFYDEEGEIGFKLGQWSFTIDGADASSLVQTDTTDVEQNQIRVRFIGSEDYMGKTLKVSYSSVTGIVSNVDIQISGA